MLGHFANWNITSSLLKKRYSTGCCRSQLRSEWILGKYWQSYHTKIFKSGRGSTEERALGQMYTWLQILFSGQWSTKNYQCMKWMLLQYLPFTQNIAISSSPLTGSKFSLFTSLLFLHSMHTVYIFVIFPKTSVSQGNWIPSALERSDVVKIPLFWLFWCARFSPGYQWNLDGRWYPHISNVSRHITIIGHQLQSFSLQRFNKPFRAYWFNAGYVTNVPQCIAVVLMKDFLETILSFLI